MSWSDARPHARGQPRVLALQRLAAYAVVGLVGLGMAAWTFGKWPDPLVDFGKEPYIAWRLSEGQVLYSELAHFNGPLSPYLNALLFYCFGPSLVALWSFNALVAAGICGLIVRQLERCAGLLAATAAGLTFVSLFACAQLTPIGNYNYLSPITHELTHGLLLALLMISRLGAATRRRTSGFLGVGLCLGLSFLTRAELFVAAAMSCGAGLYVDARLAGSSWRRVLRRGLLVGGVALGVSVAACGALCLVLPLRAAIDGTLGTWPTLLRGDVAALPFYRHGLGIDAPLANGLALIGWSAGYAVWLGVGYVAARGVRERRLQNVATGALVVLPFVVWSLFGSPGLLRDVARPLPVVTLGLWVMHLRKHGPRQPLTAAERESAVVLAAWLGLALGMLLKIALYTRLHHYGFAHAMPAALLAVVGLVAWLPAWVQRTGGSAPVMRAVSCGLILTLAAAYLGVQARQLAARQHPIGRGPDQLLADGRAPYVNALLAAVEHTAPSATLAVYPEGALVNFLSKRVNPTPFPSLMPTELTSFGETRLLAALRDHAPDYVALVHRDTSEFGTRFFGRDYAARVGALLRERYEPIQQIGAVPLQDDQFGILLLRRRELHTRER
ncbi:MAG: hypothetical protein ABW321_04115 [Polyangiales bacterium]